MLALRHLTPDDLPELHRLEGLIALFPEGAFGFFDGAGLAGFDYTPGTSAMKMRLALR